MKKSRFTDSQIIDVLKRAEAGLTVPELCRELGISSATFYKWRAKFGGMDASLMARMKELEEENRRLRKMYVEEKLKAEVVSEALAKNVWSASHLQGSFCQTKAVCTNVSGLSRVGCGCSQAMMRSARTVPNKWTGFEHPLFWSGLRCADRLFRHQSRAQQTSESTSEVIIW